MFNVGKLRRVMMFGRGRMKVICDFEDRSRSNIVWNVVSGVVFWSLLFGSIVMLVKELM